MPFIQTNTHTHHAQNPLWTHLLLKLCFGGCPTYLCLGVLENAKWWKTMWKWGGGGGGFLCTILTPPSVSARSPKEQKPAVLPGRSKSLPQPKFESISPQWNIESHFVLTQIIFFFFFFFFLANQHVNEFKICEQGSHPRPYAGRSRQGLGKGVGGCS